MQLLCDRRLNRTTDVIHTKPQSTTNLTGRCPEGFIEIGYHRAVKLSQSSLGPLSPWLIALAAMLWGSDLLLRAKVVSAGWSASYIVLAEHLILTAIFVIPLWLGRRHLAQLTRRQWAALAFVGVGGSALGTWLYTTAFTLDYSRALTVVLLQKTQPVFALLLAATVLKERRSPVFWGWCVMALFGACLLVVGDKSFALHLHSRLLLEQALLAIAASALWGAATVVGRPLSVLLPPSLLSGARFALALPVLALLALFAVPPPITARTPEIGVLLLLVALVPGLLGMSLYYRGLRGTTASVATLAELCYPLTSLLIGVVVLHVPMTGSQWAGLLLLLAAVLALGRQPGLVVTEKPLRELSPAIS